MTNWDIYIGIAIAIVVIVIVCYLLSKVCKVLFAILSLIFKPVTWFFRLFISGNKKGKSKSVASATTPKYKSLAEFAATVAADPKTIDSNLHAIFIDLRDEIGSIYDETNDELGKAILAEPLASLEIIANAKIKDKDKPILTSVFDLAEAVSEKSAKLDPALRGIFLEIYDYVELYSPDDATEGAYYQLAYDVERTLFPNDGPSQSQAEAASKRQAKKEAAIKAKMTTPRESTPA